MELIIDFGNTLQKVALFDHGNLLEVTGYSQITAATIEILLTRHPDITSSILSSVIHHPPEINQLLEKKTRFIELDTTTPLPITNLYHTGDTLGKDRLAAAVGGASAFPGQNVLVIGAGTALTMDFINHRGEYLGGSIAPGMRMRFNALHTFTGKLPLVEYTGNAPLTGRSTHDSILSGVVNGMTAEIEAMAARYHKEYPQLTIILSGGDLIYFDKRLNISIFARPNIVIHGLYQILSFNVNPS